MTPANHWANRNAAIAHYEPLFAYDHLPPHLREVSVVFSVTAERLLERLTDGPELNVALRKLLESKDAAVRQAVIDSKRSGS